MLLYSWNFAAYTLKFEPVTQQQIPQGKIRIDRHLKGAGMVRVWVASKTVWSPCYTRPYLSTLQIKGLYIKMMMTMMCN